MSDLKSKQAEEKKERQREAAMIATRVEEERRQEKFKKMQEQQAKYEREDNDLRERKSFGNKLKSTKTKTDKFCNKFCFTFWVTFPSVLQTVCLFAQELINVYIVGRSGDYAFIDVVGMTNILLYFGVFGTAIVFNSVLETLVPHALATNRVELSGHILNRGLFLWTMLFGGAVATALNSGFLLSTFLH